MNFLILVSLIISLDSGIHYPYLDPGNSRSLTREEYVERIRDRVNIVLSDGLGGGEVLVGIYDVVGREVRRLSYGLVGREIVIDMGGLRQGIYFISVEVGSCRGVRRIVKIGG